MTAAIVLLALFWAACGCVTLALIEHWASQFTSEGVTAAIVLLALFWVACRCVNLSLI